MVKPKKNKDTSTTTKTTAASTAANNANNKIDRRKREFRGLPKQKKKHFGPPKKILKARIDPKYKEMRQKMGLERMPRGMNDKDARDGAEDRFVGDDLMKVGDSFVDSKKGKEDEKFLTTSKSSMMMTVDDAWRNDDVKRLEKFDAIKNNSLNFHIPSKEITTKMERERNQLQLQQQQQQQQQNLISSSSAIGAAGSIDIHGNLQQQHYHTTTTATTGNDLRVLANMQKITPKNYLPSEIVNPPKSEEEVAAAKRKRDAIRIEEEEIERQKKDDAKWRPVCLCRSTMAKGIELDETRLVASSQKGYRCVQATRAVEIGSTLARYFELKIDHLGESGCVRVGWMTRRGEMNAPVGFDNKGYSYHAGSGSKYHEARLKTYGEPFSEGDVIGCYLYLDEDGKEVVVEEEQENPETLVVIKSDDDVKGEESHRKGESNEKEKATKKQPSSPEKKKNRKEQERLAKELENKQTENKGKIVFYKNGKFQGVAFESLRSCVHPKKPELSGYYPTAAIYTMPLQEEHQRARISFNFGPDFAYPIDAEKDGLPPCKGFSPDLDPPKPPPSLSLEDKGKNETVITQDGGDQRLQQQQQHQEKDKKKEEEQQKKIPTAIEVKKESTSNGERESPQRALNSKDDAGADGHNDKEKKNDIMNTNTFVKAEEEKVIEEKVVDDGDVVTTDTKVNNNSEAAAVFLEDVEKPLKAEAEVTTFGKLSATVEPASFLRPDHPAAGGANRGFDAFVEANIMEEDEEEEEEEEEKVNDDDAANNDDTDAAYNWLSG